MTLISLCSGFIHLHDVLINSIFYILLRMPCESVFVFMCATWTFLYFQDIRAYTHRIKLHRLLWNVDIFRCRIFWHCWLFVCYTTVVLILRLQCVLWFQVTMLDNWCGRIAELNIRHSMRLLDVFLWLTQYVHICLNYVIPTKYLHRTCSGL